MKRHLLPLKFKNLLFGSIGGVALFFLSLLLVEAPQVSAKSPSALSAEGEVPSRGSADVSDEVARKAAAISRQTMSPFCPGRTLSDCPSGYATEWRRDIRAMVKKGMSAAEIKEELNGRVRGDLSGIPNSQSSFALPIGLALGAGLLLFFVFARLGRKGRVEPQKEETSSQAEAKPQPVDDERLQSELDAEEY